MRYLIDGHNLIPKLGLSLKDLDDEEKLINILGEFCRLTRSKAEIYFDNAPPGFSGKRKRVLLTIHYVRAGTTADEAIRRRLRQLGREARNWCVVSSDREVRAAARRAGSSTQSSEAFARDIRRQAVSQGDASGEKPNPTQTEIEEWLEIFGETEDRRED